MIHTTLQRKQQKNAHNVQGNGVSFKKSREIAQLSFSRTVL